MSDACRDIGRLALQAVQLEGGQALYACVSKHDMQLLEFDSARLSCICYTWRHGDGCFCHPPHTAANVMTSTVYGVVISVGQLTLGICVGYEGHGGKYLPPPFTPKMSKKYFPCK